MKKITYFRKAVKLLIISNIVAFCLIGCAEEKSDDLKSISLEGQTELNPEESTKETQKKEKQEDSKEKICVYVCGAVKTPGVYELENGARIHEAIAYAGGLKPEADENYVNQAQLLEDGVQIYIPTEEETKENSFSAEVSASSSGITEDGKVDLNLATKEDLMTLDGIGESRAESILAYRQNNGVFQCIEDLMKVDGIKEGVFQKIKDSITVNTGS
ncbi:MAG: ComEA family DNA-binding protein [Schaedlerella sp.]|nr:ComEA family DNA-binding protein [Schaedlerella sp.]